MASAASDAKRRLNKLFARPDPTSRAEAEERLGQIRELKAEIKKDAETVQIHRTMDSRRAEQMDAWARTPGTGSTRGRNSEPPHRVAMKKIAHLCRGGLPNPLRLDEFSYGRLSPKESLELLDLTQRAMRGGTGFNAEDIPRRDMLLEKACGASPGAIAQWDETMTNVNGRWVRKADVEAYERALAEFKEAEAKFHAVRSKLPSSDRQF